MNQLWFHLKFISPRFNSSLTFIFTIIVLTVTDHHDRKLPKSSAKVNCQENCQSSVCHFFNKVESTMTSTSLGAIRKMQIFLPETDRKSRIFESEWNLSTGSEPTL